MEVYLKDLENKRKPRIFDMKISPLAKAAVTGLFAFYSAKWGYRYLNNNAEMKLKKERLSMPVYEVTEADLESPPWLNDYENWKYRLVKIHGRFVHRNTTYVPRNVNAYQGYDYIVPCAVTEEDRMAVQKGFLVNKGWIPHDMKAIENRNCVENSYVPETVVGMLSKSEDLERSIFFKGGNVQDEQRFTFNNLNFREIVKMSTFANKKAMEVALIEAIDTEFTKLDEKDPHFYARAMGPEYDWPYKKTLAGALQPKYTDRELAVRSIGYGIVAVLALLL